MPSNDSLTVTGNRLLAQLPEDELAPMRPHMARVSLGYAHPLIVPRDPIRDVHFPLTCLASLVTVFEDGSTVESGSVGREGMVGIPILMNVDTTPMQTFVQIPGDAIRVKASVVKEVFARGRAFHRLLNKYVHTLFVIASQSAGCNRRHQVNARLARWLLMSSDGIGCNNVPLTHEFLATMLGVRRSGVTEAAQKLQDDGLIQYSRGGIQIVERGGLEEAACECYHVVKGLIDALFD